jgi:hypothetical protein
MWNHLFHKQLLEKNSQTENLVWFGLWCLSPFSTILQYIAAAGFTGGGNRNT